MIEIPNWVLCCLIVWILGLISTVIRQDKQLRILKKSMFIAFFGSSNDKARKELVDAGAERMLKVETLIPYMLIEAGLMGEYFQWLNDLNKKKVNKKK